MKFRSRLKQIFAVAILTIPALALAQPSAPAPSGPATQEQIASLQAAVQNAQSNADNAWMLVSAALVLLMTGPGLALFYGGLVRKKNILATMMQSFAMMGLVTILWAILGYSLAFGHGNSFIGACLLWVGWFGFNAGSALNSGGLATSAFVNTHFAAAAAALGWTITEWIHNGKPTALGAISGAVAGLVAITPASGFVEPFPALLIGLIAGAFCSLMVFEVKSRLGYDDSLDAFGVHGAGGTLGALMTGLFATKAINAIFGKDTPTGAADGHWGQLINQSAGIAIAWILSAVGTLVLLFIVDKVIGLRVSPEDESTGLDLSQHGEEGYDLNS